MKEAMYLWIPLEEASTGRPIYRKGVMAVLEHRHNENTLDSTNVKGKL